MAPRTRSRNREPKCRVCKATEQAAPPEQFGILLKNICDCTGSDNHIHLACLTHLLKDLLVEEIEDSGTFEEPPKCDQCGKNFKSCINIVVEYNDSWLQSLLPMLVMFKWHFIHLIYFSILSFCMLTFWLGFFFGERRDREPYSKPLRDFFVQTQRSVWSIFWFMFNFVYFIRFSSKVGEFYYELKEYWMIHNVKVKVYIIDPANV